MNCRVILFSLVIVLSMQRLVGQETVYGPGYQTIMLSNPAFAGTEGGGTLRLSYFNFYPGLNYNLNSFFASYDTFLPLLHGGAAAFLSNDYMGGIVNDMRGGISYAYHLQAEKNIFINAGLSASFFHRGFNMSRMVFPDQIDPLGGVVYQSSEQMNIKGKTVFDVGTGFLLMAGKYTAAISINHLTAPDISGDGITEQRISRGLTVQLSGLIGISKDHKIDLRPLFYSDFQGSRLILGAGGSLESGLISLNAMVLTNKAGDLDLQTGFYLHRGVISFFYNYCFNISSGNNLLPASLVHHAGIVVSLNNVDKRKIIKTINFPKC